MDEVQEQLEDLKKRVADLEKAEIKLRVQSVGPRGPQGPPGFHGQQGERGERGRDGSDGVTPSKETLGDIVAQILSEYHLLDENGNPYAGPYAKK